MIYKMLSNWYVYKLIDPRDDKVFYIGKGKENRIDEHEKQTLRGVCSDKCNKIRDIMNSGHVLIKEKIALFWDEKAAYNAETDIIDEHGLHNLTNVYPGGHGAFSRRVTKRQVYTVKPTPPLMQIIERMSGHLAYWLKGYERPSPNNLYTATIYKICDRYFPIAMQMGMAQNPEKMREIFSGYGIR